MKSIALICLGAAVSTLTASAIDTSKLPPPSAKKDLSYDKDIKPLFEASCTRCHGGDRPKAGLRLNSLEGALKGSKEGKVIEVGKSEKSQLVIAVSQLDPEMIMPPKKAQKGPPPGAPAAKLPPAKPLSAEEVGIVRAWIDQGAK